MKRTKQDYLGLLNETIKYYSEDTSRRGVNGLSCEYKTKKGQMCAVGRCLKDNSIDHEYDNGLAATTLFNKYGYDILKKEYQGYNVRFWTLLQKLHDDSKHWDGENKSLTKEGEVFVSKIKDYIIENVL